MAVLKCKMCGGELSYEPDATVCECEYCGSKQTLPKLNDDKKANLYDRANILDVTTTLTRLWEFTSRFLTRTIQMQKHTGHLYFAVMVSSTLKIQQLTSEFQQSTELSIHQSMPMKTTRLRLSMQTQLRKSYMKMKQKQLMKFKKVS